MKKTDYRVIGYCISGQLELYVGEQQYNEWKSEVYKNTYYIPMLDFDITPDFNIKHFVRYFNIDKETLKSILGTGYDPTGERGWFTLNDRQIDALYSDDPEELYNAFPSEYGFFYNGKAYARYG